MSFMNFFNPSLLGMAGLLSSRLPDRVSLPVRAVSNAHTTLTGKETLSGRLVFLELNSPAWGWAGHAVE